MMMPPYGVPYAPPYGPHPHGYDQMNLMYRPPMAYPLPQIPPENHGYHHASLPPPVKIKQETVLRSNENPSPASIVPKNDDEVANPKVESLRSHPPRTDYQPSPYYIYPQYRQSNNGAPEDENAEKEKIPVESVPQSVTQRHLYPVRSPYPESQSSHQSTSNPPEPPRLSEHSRSAKNCESPNRGEKSTNGQPAPVQSARRPPVPDPSMYLYYPPPPPMYYRYPPPVHPNQGYTGGRYPPPASGAPPPSFGPPHASSGHFPHGMPIPLPGLHHYGPPPGHPGHYLPPPHGPPLPPGFHMTRPPPYYGAPVPQQTYDTESNLPYTNPEREETGPSHSCGPHSSSASSSAQDENGCLSDTEVKEEECSSFEHKNLSTPTNIHETENTSQGKR